MPVFRADRETPKIIPDGGTLCTMNQLVIERLTKPSDKDLEELSDVLLDVVEGGASVGFMLPISIDTAHAFWRKVALEVEQGRRALLVARDTEGKVCGTVQLILAMPENQPHRADIAKMQVHRRSRRQGAAQQLLLAAEDWAKEFGKSLLVLDTVSGSDASRIYERAGWHKVGEIPHYALWPQGGHCATTYYYKSLAPIQ